MRVRKSGQKRSDCTCANSTRPSSEVDDNRFRRAQITANSSSRCNERVPDLLVPLSGDVVCERTWGDIVRERARGDLVRERARGESVPSPPPPGDRRRGEMDL